MSSRSQFRVSVERREADGPSVRSLMKMRRSSSARRLVLDAAVVGASSVLIVLGGRFIGSLVDQDSCPIPPAWTARNEATAIRGAAKRYVLSNEEAKCPTMDDLVDANELSSLASDLDPWGRRYRIV